MLLMMRNKGERRDTCYCIPLPVLIINVQRGFCFVFQEPTAIPSRNKKVGASEEGCCKIVFCEV